jgi:hypothetical protein
MNDAGDAYRIESVLAVVVSLASLTGLVTSFAHLFQLCTSVLQLIHLQQNKSFKKTFAIFREPQTLVTTPCTPGPSLPTLSRRICPSRSTGAVTSAMAADR